ncbi:MAG TPA: right-handed parallel beta-helix repeat-containing protein [Puia sp.]|nr:right-handed parallel beta-helix repeat-containing protein [Puia sp.]
MTKISLFSILCFLAFAGNPFFVLAVTAPVQDVSPRAYYISNGGDDKQTGSSDHPWKTLDRLKNLRLLPGDSVLFAGGQVFTGSLLIDSNSLGTADHPIFIGSYGKGQAKIDGGNGEALILYKTEYVRVTHLRLAGSGRKQRNTKNGFALLNSRFIQIADLDISGFQKSGLLIYTSQHIGVSGVVCHDNGSAGITVEGDSSKKDSRDIRIRHCRAENNPGDPTNLTNHSGNGIVVGHCTSVLIEYCSATNNGWDMPRIGNGPVGIWCYEADSVTIQHCLSYKNKTSPGGADGGGFDLDGGVTNSFLQYNLSYGNQGSGYCIFQYWGASPWYNNVVRYNISENDGLVSDSRSGLYVWNSSNDSSQFHDCLVYNNTVYNAREAAISFSETSARYNFAFYNNIFVGRDSLIRGDKGKDIFLGNDWWSIEKKFNADKMNDFAGWARRYNKEIRSGKLVGFNMNPRFKNPGNMRLTHFPDAASYDAYRIPSASVLRVHGIDLQQNAGIQTGGLDFNQHPAPARGVGASF